MFQSRYHYYSDDEIESAITQVYIHIDFFAAPYLGHQVFNETKIYHYETFTTHLGEHFQQWRKSLPTSLLARFSLLNKALWSSIQHDEITWRRLLIGIPIYDDTGCLFIGRDTENLLRNLLKKHPKLISTLNNTRWKKIIDAWYSTQPTIIQTRQTSRTEIEVTRNKEEKQDTSILNQSNNTPLIDSIKILFINIEYFEQLFQKNNSLDEHLQSLKNHLLPQKSDKEQKIDDSAYTNFLSSLSCRTPNNPCDNCIRCANHERTAALCSDKTLLKLIHSFKYQSNHITAWYNEQTDDITKARRNNKIHQIIAGTLEESEHENTSISKMTSVKNDLKKLAEKYERHQSYIFFDMTRNFNTLLDIIEEPLSTESKTNARDTKKNLSTLFRLQTSLSSNIYFIRDWFKKPLEQGFITALREEKTSFSLFQAYDNHTTILDHLINLKETLHTISKTEMDLQDKKNEFERHLISFSCCKKS